MNKRKYDQPPKIDMDFEEALGRFANTDATEVEKSILEEERDGPVELVEYEETGERFLIYASDREAKLELRFDGEPWLTQAQMAEIFGVAVPTVNEHIKRFLDDGELDDSVIRKFRITAKDGKNYNVQHYGLDVAFYVGYRVNSRQGILFRRWATNILIQFATKGFVVDVARLKSPDTPPDRVAELRDIVRDIRSSEANTYREVRQLCTMCKDYDPKSKEWQRFFARMQNKIFWATVQTVATQLRLDRADAGQPNMGLTSWDGDRLLQKHTLTAKNYLGRDETESMNRLTVMLLDFIDDQLKEQRIALMADLEAALDSFIKNANRPLLPKRGVHIPTKTVSDKHCKDQHKIYSEQRALAEPEPDTRPSIEG